MSMKFRDYHEADAWVAFVAAFLSRGSGVWTDAVANADDLLEAYRARWDKPRPPPTDVPGKGFDPF